jgi:hypothetical protein
LRWALSAKQRQNLYRSVHKQFPSLKFVAVFFDVETAIRKNRIMYKYNRQSLWDCDPDNELDLWVPGLDDLGHFVSTVEEFRMYHEPEAVMRFKKIPDNCKDDCVHDPHRDKRVLSIAVGLFKVWLWIARMMPREKWPMCSQRHLLTLDCLWKRHVDHDAIRPRWCQGAVNIVEGRGPKPNLKGEIPPWGEGLGLAGQCIF